MTAKEAAALDLTELCGFSAEELSAGLRGELVPLAADFVAAEAEYGVNAVFLAALAAHESGWGRHCFLPENIFGWGGNLEVKQDENGDTLPILYTESLTEPVEIQDGRMYFIVNGERIDITDSVSETQPYEYSYIDEENVTHYWMIGLNGPELEHYGYGEFLQNADGAWLGGYVARTNMESDGSYPSWVSAGKEDIHAPEN